MLAYLVKYFFTAPPLLAVWKEICLCEKEELGLLGILGKWETTGATALGVVFARGRDLLAMETASFIFWNCTPSEFHCIKAG